MNHTLAFTKANFKWDNYNKAYVAKGELGLGNIYDRQINGLLDGYIIIEHSEQHGVRSSGKMDPFGVEANFFPYLLSEWFAHSISLKIIRSIKKNKSNSPVWFFLIKKAN